MDGKHHLLQRAFQLHHRNRLRNNLGSLWPDDVHAQNLTVLRIGDHFHKPVVTAQDRRLRVSRKRELAHLHLEALFLRLRLRQPPKAA